MRNGDSKLFGGLAVDYELEFGRGLHRQVTGLGALEDSVDIGRCAPEEIEQVGAIRDQAAAADEVAKGIGGGQSMLRCQCDDPLAMDRRKDVGHHDHCAVWLTRERCEDTVDLVSIVCSGNDKLDAQ